MAVARRTRTLDGEGASRDSHYIETYLVFDATDQGNAVATAYAAAPATVAVSGGTLYRGGHRWELYNPAADAAEDSAAGTYRVAINYETITRTRLGLTETRVTYDTTGGTEKIFRGYTETIYPTTPALTFHKILNNAGVEREGVDIPVPKFTLTVEKVFDPIDAPPPGDLFWLTGRSNDADYTITDSKTLEVYEFLYGELIFLGSRRGQVRDDGLVSLFYEFIASPNLINQTIGDITGINKKGAEYLWVRYRTVVVGAAAAKNVVQYPKYVIVNQILLEGDFGGLLI